MRRGGTSRIQLSMASLDLLYIIADIDIADVPSTVPSFAARLNERGSERSDHAVIVGDSAGSAAHFERSGTSRHLTSGLYPCSFPVTRGVRSPSGAALLL